MYVNFNGQTFSSVFEQFSFTSKFFGLKMLKYLYVQGYNNRFICYDPRVLAGHENV